MQVVGETGVAQHACVHCGNAGSLRCAGCHSAFYCSRGCQKAHWPAHKQTCKRISRGGARTGDSAAAGTEPECADSVNKFDGGVMHNLPDSESSVFTSGCDGSSVDPAVFSRAALRYAQHQHLLTAKDDGEPSPTTSHIILLVPSVSGGHLVRVLRFEMRDPTRLLKGWQEPELVSLMGRIQAEGAIAAAVIQPTGRLRNCPIHGGVCGGREGGCPAAVDDCPIHVREVVTVTACYMKAVQQPLVFHSVPCAAQLRHEIAPYKGESRIIDEGTERMFSDASWLGELLDLLLRALLEPTGQAAAMPKSEGMRIRSALCIEVLESLDSGSSATSESKLAPEASCAAPTNTSRCKGVRHPRYGIWRPQAAGSNFARHHLKPPTSELKWEQWHLERHVINPWMRDLVPSDDSDGEYEAYTDYLDQSAGTGSASPEGGEEPEQVVAEPKKSKKKSGGKGKGGKGKSGGKGKGGKGKSGGKGKGGKGKSRGKGKGGKGNSGGKGSAAEPKKSNKKS